MCYSPVCVLLVSRYQTIRDLRLLIVWGHRNSKVRINQRRERPPTKQRPLHFWKGYARTSVLPLLSSARKQTHRDKMDAPTFNSVLSNVCSVHKIDEMKDLQRLCLKLLTGFYRLSQPPIHEYSWFVVGSLSIIQLEPDQFLFWRLLKGRKGMKSFRRGSLRVPKSFLAFFHRLSIPQTNRRLNLWPRSPGTQI